MARKSQKKIYYKIGEVCKELDIQPYVLRYWETEFPVLNPDKSRSGQRVYGEKEIGLIRRIKELLYDEGYTIAGAKKRLESEAEGGASQADGDGASALDTHTAQHVQRLRRGIGEAVRQAREILELLDSPSP